MNSESKMSKSECRATDYTLPPLLESAKDKGYRPTWAMVKECAEAARAPLLAANAALSARIAELERLVREMDEHEGAEGWSNHLRKKIDSVWKGE